jgi:uncharacterized integral membrane protein
MQDGNPLCPETWTMISKPAVAFILFGLFLLLIFAISLVAGHAPLRYSSGVDQAEQPIMFWLGASIYLVGGVIMLAIGIWRLLRRR